MDVCPYNGSCTTCTHKAMEFVRTDEELICCVHDSDTVPGWVKFIARTPSECPITTNSFHISTVIAVALAVMAAIAVVVYFFTRFRSRGYARVRELSPSIIERHGQTLADSTGWESIELDAVVASMEATTAL